MIVRIATRQLLLAGLLTVCLLSLFGCGAKTGAEKVLAKHFQVVATNGFEEAMADYSTLFFTHTPRQQWRASLENARKKLGDYQRYSVISWRVSETAGTAGTGTYVELRCQTTYSKYPAQETFVLFKGSRETQYKIVKHSFDSAGLLKE